MKERSKGKERIPDIWYNVDQKFGTGMADWHLLPWVRAEKQCVDGGGARIALKIKRCKPQL